MLALSSYTIAYNCIKQLKVLKILLLIKNTEISPRLNLQSYLVHLFSQFIHLLRFLHFLFLKVHSLIKGIVGTLHQVSSSDMLMRRDKRAVPALLITQMTLSCHVLRNAQPLHTASTLIATLHNLEKATVVRREVVFQLREFHCLAAAITLIGAVDNKTGNVLMSIPILEHIERWLGLLCAPAGRTGVGFGFTPLDAPCTVDLPTAVCLHWVKGY